MPVYIPPLTKKLGIVPIPTVLNDLADVIVSAPVSGDSLVWNGTYWVSKNMATQEELDAAIAAEALVNSGLQNQIDITNSNTANLQLQINELVTGVNIVFCEEFTGNGVSSTPQLNGSITNGVFISGGWSAIEVANTLPAYITDLDGKPIYNSSNIFTRTRINVSTINGSGLVTLSGIPQNLQGYKVWYFYSLSSDDRLDNYYRDDFVAEMEQELIGGTTLGTLVLLNTAAFDGILNGTHTTAQAAFDAIDDHIHPQYTSLTVTAGISGDLQSQINNIAEESTVVASSGGSILVTQNGSLFNIEVASAPIQDHNLLNDLQGNGPDYFHLTSGQFASISGGVDLSAYTPLSTTAAISGSLDSRIDILEGNPVPDIFRSEVAGISGDLQGQINAIAEESTTVASSGGSILVTQNGTTFNIEVASAPIQDHNDLNGLQGNGPDYFHLTTGQFASISGGVDLSAYTLLTTTSDISASFDSRVDNIELLYATKASPVSGTYNNVVVNSQGIVISGGNVTYSANVDLSAYTLLSTTASVSADLQLQIDNISVGSTDIASSGGSILVTQNGSLFNIEVASAPIQDHNDLNGLQGGIAGQFYHLTADQFFGITASASGGNNTVVTSIIQGRIPCTSASEYLITHDSLNSAANFPVVSLEIPDKDSDIFVQGIYDRTDTSFKVKLSGTPSSSDAILYHLIVSNPVSFVTNDTLSGITGDFTLLSTTAAISGDLQSQIDDRVPYTGATGDVNLGDHKLLTDAIQLDLTSVAPSASTKGQISWNATEGTANIGLGEVTLQVGLESLNLVYNEEGSTIYNGQLVYIHNHNHDGNPAVKLARADIEETSLVFGMATQDIGISGTGFVTSRGKVRDLDTSSYMEGAVLYLSDSVWGGWTAETSGFALSSHKNKIGYVGPSDVSSGYVFIDIDNEAVNSTLSRTEEIIASGLSMSTGVYDYSGMTIATSASFTVPPLKGWIVENTGVYATAPRMTNVIFAGGTYPVTNILTDINTYVLISKTGVISQQVTLPTPTQRRDNIYLGKVAHSNKSSINIINNTADYAVSPFSALRDVFTPIAIMNAGITPYPDGANLSFNKTAGSLYGLGINWAVDNKNPNKVTFTGSTPASFNLFTQTAPELFGTTLIQPGFYDVAGVKTAVPGNSSRSTNVRIYQFTTGVVGVQYGQTVYTSLANAVAATQTESYIPYPGFAGNAILIGILSVRRTATDLSDPAFAIFTPVSILGEATGGTAGLSTTTLQQAYDNSTSPEILTNSTLDGVTFRRGSASDSDDVIQVQSGAGVNVFQVNGLGDVTTASISGNAGNLVAHDINGKLIDAGAKISDYMLLSTTASVTGDFDARINLLEGIKDDTNEPNGFINRTDSTLYYTPTPSGTPTFAISGNYAIYLDGNKFNKTGDSATLTPAYGTQFLYYIYNTGIFTVSPTLFDIARDAPIAYVFFNDGATDSFLAEERHGITMDGVTHQYLHRTVGSKYVSGMTLGDYNLNSDTVANNKYSIAAGTFYDEDILNAVPALPDDGPYTIFYRTGASGNWTWSKTEAYPYFIATGGSPYIQYNQFNGSEWVLTTNTTNNRWINYYVFATNAVTPGFGYVIIPGQTVHTSLANAQAEGVSSLSLGNLPFAEIVPVARVTHAYASGHSTTNGRARIVAVASLTATSFASSVATASNHNSLSGLQGGTTGEYYHLTQDQSSDFIGRTEVASISGNLQNQINAIVIPSPITSVSGSSILINTNNTVIQTATPIVTSLWTTPIDGELINIRNNTSSGSNTISGSGYNIEGDTTFTIYNGEAFTFRFDGTSWWAF